MCGIAGIVLNPGKSRPDLHERLETMAQAITHRGPDDQGVFVAPDGRVGLANRRLAMRDLSPAGHMPMANDDNSLWITYNGEIYNAEALRRELEALGQRFRSHSDTEVILRGYEAWGVQAVARLRGMFAFALLDLRPAAGPSGRLLLARDPMGIKPLYYAQTKAGLVFASELKAMRASGLAGDEISPASLVAYLLLGSVPNPLTIYRQISALEPATWVDIALDHPAELRPVTYWRLPDDISPPASHAEAISMVRERLLDAVRVRLVSDVPLGAFLSGGLDSSSVVMLMRAATDGPIRTCSMVFEETEYSEAPYARAVAEAAGAEHFERVISAQDVLAELDAMLASLDQPSVDGVNTWFVAQTARQAGLTVALSGLGGDELFGGYPNTFVQTFQVQRALHLVQAMPGGAGSDRAAAQPPAVAPRGRRARPAALVVQRLFDAARKVEHAQITTPVPLVGAAIDPDRPAPAGGATGAGGCGQRRARGGATHAGRRGGGWQHRRVGLGRGLAQPVQPGKTARDAGEQPGGGRVHRPQPARPRRLRRRAGRISSHCNQR